MCPGWTRELFLVGPEGRNFYSLRGLTVLVLIFRDFSDFQKTLDGFIYTV